MIRRECPACGAEIQFQSSVSVFAVCKYCRSSIIRDGEHLKDLGKMAAIAPEMSVLQLGTAGWYFKRSFIVIGKARMAWSEGFWNEWNLLFVDGGQGWLAEAQGFYSIGLLMPVSGAEPKLEDLSVGDVFADLAECRLEVNDIKKAHCIASEGELPVAAIYGRQVTSVDLSGPHNIFANLEYSEDGLKFFKGHYLDFDELKLSNLRKLDGW